MKTDNSDNLGLKKILYGTKHFKNAPRVRKQKTKTVTLSSSLKKGTFKKPGNKSTCNYSNYVNYLPPGIDSENLDYIYD